MNAPTATAPIVPLPQPKRGIAAVAKYAVAGLVLAAGWWFVYGQLAPVAHWLTYRVFGLAADTHLASAVEFFVFEVPKVLMLLVLVVFGVGIVRSYFTPDRTRAILAGKRESTGNVLAALLGVVTPFCSCSRGAALYRLCHDRGAARGHVFIPDFCSDGQ